MDLGSIQQLKEGEDGTEISEKSEWKIVKVQKSSFFARSAKSSMSLKIMRRRKGSEAEE